MAFGLLGLNQEQHGKLRHDLIDCVCHHAFKKGKADQIAIKVGRKWDRLIQPFQEV